MKLHCYDKKVLLIGDRARFVLEKEEAIKLANYIIDHYEKKDKINNLNLKK
jgi:hypothetical protein